MCKTEKIVEEKIKGKEEFDPVFNPKKPQPYYLSIGFIITSIFFFISSTGTIILWGTDVFQTSILKVLTFEDGGYIYSHWKKPAVDTIISVYAFNYTNIDRISTEKPHVVELGPYVFKERIEKVDVVFHSNGSLTYSENRTHEFDSSSSNGSLDDRIYTPNVPFISAAAEGSKRHFISQIGLAAVLKGLDTRPFLPVRVEDFVMGFDDSFSLVARRISSLLNGNAPPKFGLLGPRNGLSPERVTIGTGIPDLDGIGVVSNYDGVSSLDYWSTDECNKLTGGDGSIFPGNVVKDASKLYVYVKGFCRRIPLVFYGEETRSQTFPVKRFELPTNFYSFGPDNEENYCYCRDNVCPPTGTFSTSVCSFGAPILVSYPHFLHGDPELRENVTGLTPDFDKHRFYLDIHKTLGIPLGSKSRFQVNVQVRHCPFLNGLNSIPNGTVLPIAWIEIEIGKISEELYDLIYHATYTAVYINKVLSWASLILTLTSSIKLIHYFMFM